MQQSTTPTTSPGEEAAAERHAQIERNLAALAFLAKWDQDDPDEQRETWALLQQGLDEDPITFRRAAG